MSAITRPVLRYHGGKWRLAPWLISLFPAHKVYVEAFGGGGSVLLRKSRVDGEVYNDLDGEVVNIFRTLRDPISAAELRRRLTLTPFAREEMRAAYEPATDPIDAAAKSISRSFMGFGSASMTRMHITGFRTSSKRSKWGTQHNTPAVEWSNWPDQVPLFVERLKGVCIENRDAIAVMTMHDSTYTLHYVDPPYVHATRSSLRNKNGNRGHYYRHDMTDEQHEQLARFLLTLTGMVILSGYRNSIYDELLRGWTTFEKDHRADGGRPRREVVWVNDACAKRQEQRRLFA